MTRTSGVVNHWGREPRDIQTTATIRRNSNEIYVRRLLRNIKVHEDQLIFTFKDRKEITIQE